MPRRRELRHIVARLRQNRFGPRSHRFPNGNGQLKARCFCARALRSRGAKASATGAGSTLGIARSSTTDHTHQRPASTSPGIPHRVGLHATRPLVFTEDGYSAGTARQGGFGRRRSIAIVVAKLP